MQHRPKMPFAQTLMKILLCFFLCQCNGAPPKEVPEQSDYNKKRYTDKEDAFIVEELLQLPDDHIAVYGNKVWEEIAQKHAEIRKQGTSGFRQERSPSSLRSRFTDFLLCNLPENRVIVPISLMKRCSAVGNKERYTVEEEKIIMEVLLKKTTLSLVGERTLQAIGAALEKKRKAKTPGFPVERSSSGIRKHLLRLKKIGKLPNEVLGKFYWQEGETGAWTSKSTHKNVQTQVTNDEHSEDDDEWAAHMIPKLKDDTNFADHDGPSS